MFYFSFFPFFFWVPSMFMGFFFIYLFFYARKIFLARCFWVFNSDKIYLCLPAYFPVFVGLFFVMLNTFYLYVVHAFCPHLCLFTLRLGLHSSRQNFIT